MDAIVCEVLDRTPEVLASVRRAVPASVSGEIAESILGGLQAASRRLQAERTE
jgi:hypothetical protein